RPARQQPPPRRGTAGAVLRLIASRYFVGFSRASKRKVALRETYCTAGFRRSLCPLWVRSGHYTSPSQCPLYPSKRTKRTLRDFEGALSALGQKRTFHSA